MAGPIVHADDPVGGHQRDLQLGQGDQIQFAHRLQYGIKQLLERRLHVVIAIAFQQGQQQHVEEFRVRRAFHLPQEIVVAQGQQFALQQPPMGQGSVLRDDPRGALERERVAVLVCQHVAGIIGRSADMGEHGAGL